MAIRASLETQTEVVLASATNSIAFPTAVTDGQSINVQMGEPRSAGMWRESGNGHVDAAVFVETTAAQTFSAALGIYGWRADTAKWYLLGSLNNGAAIQTLGASTGFASMIQFAGVFTRLAVGPVAAANVTTGAGTATIRACQVRQIAST